MRCVGILLCAGSASRMGFDKITTPLCGRTPVERSADALIQGGVTELTLTASPSTLPFLSTLTFPVPSRIIPGGATRQGSVKNALLAGDGDIAVIHDAARCMVTAETVARCVESAARYGSGIAAAKATDTVLLEGASGIEPIPRDRVWLMQTPQCFAYAAIRSAYLAADGQATDDCTLFARNGGTPRFVPCPPDNFKLTSPLDWARAETLLTRYGTGFDTHCLVEGRKLILGGVDIPFEKGLLGHSDADVLAHAVTDALLGAAAMGDIGKLFPDSDPAYAGADSLVLLKTAVDRIREKGLSPVSVDATVIAQRPKLMPYIGQMRNGLARAAGLDTEAVSVKATTTEKMNDEGRGLCISAMAVASVR